MVTQTTAPTAATPAATSRTDFTQYTHQQLIEMLYASDPATVRTAGDRWDAVAKWLHEQAGDLESKISGFNSMWDGGASDQYQTMIKDLSAGIRTVADDALTMRDVAYGSADKLDAARAAMPQPVAVPSVDPATMSLATQPTTVPADASAATVARVQQQQQDAAQTVRAQQQAQTAADAAHAQAVQVMTTLADGYVGEQAAIPATPGGAAGLVGQLTGGTGVANGVMTTFAQTGPTVLSPLGTTVGGIANSVGSTVSPLAGPSTLFGGMFTAGLAAASAAAAGRFGALMPNVPSWATKPGDQAAKALAGAKDKATDTHLTPPAGGGGVGAGGVSVGSTGVTGDGPAAFHGMGGTASSTVEQAGLSAAAAAAPFVAKAATGTGAMVPAMPMAGMMGGGYGDTGSKRIPPWLVETEDVWGESSVVSPGVIGEDPAGDAGSPWLG